MIKDLTYDHTVSENGLVESFNIIGLPKAIGHYRHASAELSSQLSLRLLLSGMLPIDEVGNIVDGGGYTHAAKILNNISLAVANAGPIMG